MPPNWNGKTHCLLGSGPPTVTQVPGGGGVGGEGGGGGVGRGGGGVGREGGGAVLAVGRGGVGKQPLPNAFKRTVLYTLI